MKALVTGATSGIGSAIAKRLWKDGMEVIATGRREERLSRLISELGGSRITAYTADLSLPQAAESLCETTGPIDVLVNSAGGAIGLEPAQRAEVSDWMAMIRINVDAVVLLTRAYLPAMVERGSGLVVNIGSVAGEFPYPGGNVYGAAKAFVRQFSLNLKADLAGTGVRVTDIEPGMVGGTEFSAVRFKGDLEKAGAVYAGMTPLAAEDVAEVVSFVAGLPARVNINTISMMPTDQGFGPFRVTRR